MDNVLMGLGLMLYIFIDSVLFLFVVHIIIGFAEAIYSPAFDKLYTKHVCGKKTGRGWGVWEAMNYISTALGAVFGGYIVVLSGFSTLFMIMAVLCFLSVIYIYHLPKQEYFGKLHTVTMFFPFP